jgi:hypothetical protein
LNAALIRLSPALLNRAVEPAVYFSQVSELLARGVLSAMGTQLDYARATIAPKDTQREIDPELKKQTYYLNALRLENKDKWKTLSPLKFETKAIESMPMKEYEANKTRYRRDRASEKRCSDVETGLVNWKIGLVIAAGEQLEWVNSKISLILLEEAAGKNFVVNGVEIDAKSSEIVELHEKLKSYYLEKREMKDLCTVRK